MMLASLFKLVIFALLIAAHTAYAVSDLNLSILKDLQKKQVEFSTNPSNEIFTKMLEITDDISDEEQKLWAKISVLESGFSYIPKKQSLEILKDLRKAAEQLQDRKKQYFISALLHIAMTKKNGRNILDDEGLEIAIKYFPEIKSSSHHAWAANEYSNTLIMRDYPKILKNLTNKRPDEIADYLVKKSLENLNKKDWKKALTLAKAIDLSHGSKREKLLISIYEYARKNEKFDYAIEALRGIEKRSLQGKKLLSFAENLLEKDELSNAEKIANIIDDGRYASDILGILVKKYSKIGYTKLAKNSAKNAIYLADSTRDSARRYDALTLLAKRLAESGMLVDSESTLKRVQEDKKDEKFNIASLALASGLAKEGKLKSAERFYEIGKIKTDRAAETASYIMAAYADSSDIENALRFYKEVTYLREQNENNDIDSNLIKLIKAFIKNGLTEKAELAAKIIEDKKSREKVKKIIRNNKEASNSNNKKPKLAKLLKDIPENDSKKGKLAKKIIIEYGNLQEAVLLAKTIKNPILRTKTFREIAEIRSKQNDVYGLIADNYEAEILMLKKLQTGDSSIHKLKKISKEITKRQKVERGQKVKIRLPESGFGSVVPEVIHKEHLNYTTDNIREIIPESQKHSFILAPYNTVVSSLKFLEGIGYSGYFENQKELIPKLIILQSGIATLSDLYNWLNSQGLEDYIEKKEGEYLLRRPLIVKHGATFVVSSADTKHLKLSKQKGTYIASSGKIFISDVKVTGWDEKKNQPAIADYKKKYHFRPFIAFWSKSEAFIAASEFTALGYANGKAYGLSFSAGPKNLMKYSVNQPKRPTGIIVENSFNNMFYGFYSYEADDVAIIGNEYIDNIVYGIDPHDRSNRLTIAYNTTYETQQKHGIIISREVNDAAILGNVSFSNNGSGFMLDRMSIRTLVYANSSFDNKQDGISLFESSCNIIAANHVFDNYRAGIRARNSQDIGIYSNTIMNNKQTAIHGYATTLEDNAVHATRNFDMDSYGNSASLTLANNHIENNKSGLYMENVAALSLKQDKLINQSPKIARGSWFGNKANNVIDALGRKNGTLVMERCPKGSWLKYACNFREAGYFDIDGQHNLRQKFNDKACRNTHAGDEL